MYQYDEIDQKIVDERVAQYRDQTMRYLAGEIPDAEFLPIRLQNGLYVQRHAPMLRVAVPYGMLTSERLYKLADIADDYDKGYVHFSTRQNVQYNWPELEQVPDILAELATVQMHAIQTSGNCIRNTTTDEFAGIAKGEVADPRPWCEIIRQWSTFHPEFAYLPRKFKIAVNSRTDLDRAAIAVHDIGLQLVTNDAGELGFQVFVGGGMGRTPIIGSLVNEFLPWQHLLTYLDAVLRVYNLNGRRDNKYKARIKILVKALGTEAFAAKVAEEWAHLKDGPGTLTQAEVDRVSRFFIDPAYEQLDDAEPTEVTALRAEKAGFDRWVTRNTMDHRVAGYCAVTLSLKKVGVAPGDATSTQMRAAAKLADTYSFGELRVSHYQNLILTDVKKSDLPALWEAAKANGFATPTVGTLADMICCPGGDFCALANARSIPVAEAIQAKFDDMDYLYDLGDLDLNISGCMNACGHHHVGNIGILGVDKKGREFYQVTIGGESGGVNREASIGKIIGPSFEAEDIPNIIEKLLDVFVAQRHEGELFIDVVRRIGVQPFKEAAYADADK